MEESAQRRERLRAMRMEASQDTAMNNDGSEYSAVSLSNPLLESTANPEGQVQSHTPGFNYYTNPMAAFSGNKQKSQVNPQISHDYSSTPPRSSTNQAFSSPSFQVPINHSPSQRMQRPQGQYVNVNYAYRSNAPQGGNFPSPSLDFQGRNWNSNSPRAGGCHGPGSVSFPSPGPQFSKSSGHVLGQGGYPSPQPYFSSPGDSSGQGGYPSPHFRNGPHLRPGQGGNPSSGSNQGKGHWFGNSMSSGPGSGRGRGRWSGQGGGRGQGRGSAHNHVSAEDRPDLFYNKSMVEDPWKFLEPVTWKSLKKPWLPHSLSTKKARVSESPIHEQQSSSQPSLAEILAASFNEAATDEPNVG